MMRSERFKWIRAGRGILLLAASIVLLNAPGAFAGEDWQYWSTVKMSWKVAEKTSLKFLADAYLRDDMSDDYLYDQYITVDQAIGRGFHLFTQMQHVAVENNSNNWSEAWKVVPGFHYSFDLQDLCNVKVQDRFYYIVDPECEWDHHRPRIYLSRRIGPVKLTLSDELRMDLSGARERDFYRNRALISVSKTLTDSMSLAVAYVRQSDRKGGRWESFNVLQTVVGFSF